MSIDPTTSFHDLGPNEVLAAVESLGYQCDGRLLALNSYENRVYRVGIEAAEPLVAKFYRPNRWSDAEVLEEHEFAAELAADEVPVVAPLRNEHGSSLFYFQNFRFSVYPLCPGQAPELDNPEHLEQLGRFLGRLHNIGALKPFNARPRISLSEFGEASYHYLLEQDFLPAELRGAYTSLGKDLLDRLQSIFSQAQSSQEIRLHGDCHPSNLLWKDDHLFIVDLDDARSGPAVQDLWMFLAGDRDNMQASLTTILQGYCQFRHFDAHELALIEPLRTLRMMHYACWLARRHSDPAFQQAFPWFNSQQYWQNHILNLREQFSLLDEPPLDWQPQYYW